MNESLVKYLAGLLDADGSLSLTFRRDDNKPKHHYCGLKVALHSSLAVDQKGFVSTLPELTGMGGFSRYGARQQHYKWEVQKRAHVEMLLPRLIKHMVVKGKHWQWLLETWRGCRRKPLTAKECVELRKASTNSRATRSGPVRPKNHPTWAWLAGFLDGDGYYSNFLSHSKDGSVRRNMHTGCVAQKKDSHVLEFIQKAFGGHIYEHGQTKSCLTWKRSLGVANRSFALRFLPNLAKHSRLKRHKIDQMIHHHQQRLSTLSPKPRGYWTKERVLAKALKYYSARAFMKHGQGAYAAARRQGWLKDLVYRR